jgi:hypothetical protein
VVLLFYIFILLRDTRGRKLLINTMLKAKLIERDILELDEKNKCDHKENHENLSREQHEKNQRKYHKDKIMDQQKKL